MSPEPTHRNVRIGGVVTLERSHDRPRLQRPRLRDLSAPDGAARKPRRGDPRPHRAAVRALTALPRAADTELAREAMRIARALLRELGSPRSPSVRAHAMTYALQHLIGQRLALAADAAGIDTPRGLQLAGESQRASGRSERSWTACVTAAGLLGKAPSGDSPTDAIERRAAELLRQQRGGGDGR